MGRSGNRLVQFKQFEVRDDRCAMKIGTDALLLGAWAHVVHSRRILDVGSGCGIVALMVAQRAPNATVIGVELEPNAAAQAKQNASASPWSKRVQIIETSIQSFALAAEKPSFDCIVANPPFFHGKPKSPEAARNLARHDDALPVEDLLKSAQALLIPGGQLQLIWPHDRWDELCAACAESQFELKSVVRVRGSVNQSVSRLLSCWLKPDAKPELPAEVDRAELLIEQRNRINGIPQLSEAYKSLLDPYVRDWPR